MQMAMAADRAKSQDTSSSQTGTSPYVSHDIHLRSERVIRHMALQKVVST